MGHAARVPWLAFALLELLVIGVLGSAPGATDAALAGAATAASASTPAVTETAVGPDELGRNLN